MKDSSDIITWLVGILGTLTITNWGMTRRGNNRKFKHLYDEQRSHQERIGVAETRLEVLAEIKEQNKLMAEDITDIKVSMAQYLSQNNGKRK